MGIYFLSGSEYVRSDLRERILEEALVELRGQYGSFSLKTGQHTLIWRGTCIVDKVIRREERIEEGHLTVDQVFFQVTPAKQEQERIPWEITLPVDQFLAIEQYAKETIFRFSCYAWTWKPRS